MIRLTKVLATVLAATAVLSGCARFSPTPDVPGELAESAESAPSARTSEALDSNGMRPGVVPQTRVEPPSDADRADGPPPTPDGDLTAGELSALLSSSASSPATEDSCTGDGLQLTLSAADFALGHRYAMLRADNTSGRPCQLLGWPGLGLRGSWGTPFAVVAEPSSTMGDWVGVPPAEVNEPVTVPAGGRAFAEFEWTGSLAGSQDEHASLLVVELFTGAIPVAVDLDAQDSVDIGPDTTVRIGTWRPAA